jgi:hypothetical protein
VFEGTGSPLQFQKDGITAVEMNALAGGVKATLGCTLFRTPGLQQRRAPNGRQLASGRGGPAEKGRHKTEQKHLKNDTVHVRRAGMDVHQ